MWTSSTSRCSKCLWALRCGPSGQRTRTGWPFPDLAMSSAIRTKMFWTKLCDYWNSQTCCLQTSSCLHPQYAAPHPRSIWANALALKGVPVFRSDSDVSDIAPEVAQGKVLICTFHQAKGIERKASIVLGFDQSYHTWYDKVVAPPTAATNPLYVAATRALEHLVLIHEFRSAPLPFVDLQTVEQFMRIGCRSSYECRNAQATTEKSQLSASLPFAETFPKTLITACLEKLDVHLMATPAFGIQPNPPTEIEDRSGLLEGVSNVTGTAVPAIFQWRQRKRLAILEGPLKLLKPLKRAVAKAESVAELAASLL